MPDQSASWLRWVVGMGERRKLGDVAMDLVLFAGMVCAPQVPTTLPPQGKKSNKRTIQQMTAGLYIARNFLNPILSNLADPDKEKHDQARQKAKAHLERINRRRQNEAGVGDGSDDSRDGARVEELVLNEYENLIALEMIAPEDIHVGFDGE